MARPAVGANPLLLTGLDKVGISFSSCQILLLGKFRGITQYSFIFPLNLFECQ